MLKSLLVHAAISMVPTKNCAFGEYGFWRGSGLNEYIYDDLSVGDYTNGECQSETKESGGDDCTADETVDCVDWVESFNRVCVDCAVESYATGTDKMVGGDEID